jgi:hypothetical protein
MGRKGMHMEARTQQLPFSLGPCWDSAHQVILQGTFSSSMSLCGAAAEVKVKGTSVGQRWKILVRETDRE